MPWVEFTGPFNWDPAVRRGATTHAFAAGMVRLVPTACADAAIAAGRAAKTKRPADAPGDAASDEAAEPGSVSDVAAPAVEALEAAAATVEPEA